MKQEEQEVEVNGDRRQEVEVKGSRREEVEVIKKKQKKVVQLKNHKDIFIKELFRTDKGRMLFTQ